MSFLFSNSAALLLPFLLSWLLGFFSVSGQDLRERDALCNAGGCFVVYFERKTFLDSWRACKEKGGDLATIKRKEDADAIATLFSTLDLRQPRSDVLVWIGLQRQPRQCSAAHPLRGFSWATGDRDTEYTNWQREDSPIMCFVPRCVAMTYSTSEQSDSFTWLDSSCSDPVDGYLCHYAYEGMCPSLWSEGAGNALYTTPFNLVSTLLTHVPPGSVADMLCPTKAPEDQSPVLCQLREDGSAGWSREPLCTDFSAPLDSCDQNNGGCEHFCRTVDGLFFCECAYGYQLGDDGQTCEPECLPDPNGCACPDGYALAPDERSCLDVDECLQTPCEQLCRNAPGTFECQCWGGYLPNDEGVCEDVDECTNYPCEHTCENTPGSYICYCHLGYSPDLDDPSRCKDVDECRITDICEQMCANYEGGFYCYCKEGYQLSDPYTCRKVEGDSRSTTTPSFPWVKHQPGLLPDAVDYQWNSESTNTVWPTEEELFLKWVTETPRALSSDLIWVTSGLQDKRSLDPALNPLEAERDAGLLETGQRSQSEEDVVSTAAHNRILPTSSSTVSDWNTNEEEEPTTAPPSLSTPPISKGPYWWSEPLTSTQSLENSKVTHYDVPTEPSTQRQAEGKLLQSEHLQEEENHVERTQGPAVPFWFTSPQPTGESRRNGENRNSVQKVTEQKPNTWLLVGLLVPICIFIVVMAALGIVYYTRCGVQPRNQNTTDCYLWISRAHDKQGAQDPSAGVKSSV